MVRLRSAPSSPTKARVVDPPLMINASPSAISAAAALAIRAFSAARVLTRIATGVSRSTNPSTGTAPPCVRVRRPRLDEVVEVAANRVGRDGELAGDLGHGDRSAGLGDLEKLAPAPSRQRVVAVRADLVLRNAVFFSGGHCQIERFLPNRAVKYSILTRDASLTVLVFATTTALISGIYVQKHANCGRKCAPCPSTLRARRRQAGPARTPAGLDGW